MKTKVVIVILAVACAGLAIALLAAKKQGEEQHATDVNSIADFSNQVFNASLKINDLNQVNLALTNDLETTRQHSFELSSGLSNQLNAATAALNASQGDLAAARTQINGLNSHVSDLEVQNQSLEKRAGELSNNIVELDQQIAITRQKLAHSQSDNTFLQQELQRQMAQRAELEHKFNDLDELRQQVKKIKSEIFIARRLEFMHNDHSQMRGAELLMHPNVPPPVTSTSSSAPGNALNVEIGSDGSVKVIPPLGAPTNAPAH